MHLEKIYIYTHVYRNCAYRRSGLCQVAKSYLTFQEPIQLKETTSGSRSDIWTSPCGSFYVDGSCSL